MSITIDLSPEIEKQLAAMSEEERAWFVADALPEMRLLTEKESAAIVEAANAPVKGRLYGRKKTFTRSGFSCAG